eukprot:CAMPEP_0185269118 /NCGR_PEP_ID=MMETSP1359-20130426/38902_1 /TAXON_ID=552665 /ORGANISM="Bigelowiella longifila, Strain CCMP242" /LENGTH=55 /DNA_ID=CAMNT_0027860143 /DNA_START=8 /DNA_END=175 /DNA_ORIENTATION=-
MADDGLSASELRKRNNVGESFSAKTDYTVPIIVVIGVIAVCGFMAFFLHKEHTDL